MSEKTKPRYEKPRVEKVVLVPGEAVLVRCKNTGPQGKVRTGNNCAPRLCVVQGS